MVCQAELKLYLLQQIPNVSVTANVGRTLLSTNLAGYALPPGVSATPRLPPFKYVHLDPSHARNLVSWKKRPFVMGRGHSLVSTSVTGAKNMGHPKKYLGGGDSLCPTAA